MKKPGGHTFRALVLFNPFADGCRNAWQKSRAEILQSRLLTILAERTSAVPAHTASYFPVKCLLKKFRCSMYSFNTHLDPEFIRRSKTEGTICSTSGKDRRRNAKSRFHEA